MVFPGCGVWGLGLGIRGWSLRLWFNGFSRREQDNQGQYLLPVSISELPRRVPELGSGQTESPPRHKHSIKLCVTAMICGSNF
jgi:hypothetical protein